MLRLKAISNPSSIFQFFPTSAFFQFIRDKKVEGISLLDQLKIGRERDFFSLFGWVRYKKENPSASQLARLAPRWKGLTVGTFLFGTCELAWPVMTVIPLTVKPPCAQPSFPWLIGLLPCGSGVIWYMLVLMSCSIIWTTQIER